MDEEGASVSSLLLLIRLHPSLTCEGCLKIIVEQVQEISFVKINVIFWDFA